MPLIRSRPAFALTTAALMLALAGANRPASAHPHVWITDVTTFLFEEPQLVGLRHHWQFDEFFSSFVIEEHDADGDGAFDPAETRARRARARSPTCASTATSPTSGSTATPCRWTEVERLPGDASTTAS